MSTSSRVTRRYSMTHAQLRREQLEEQHEEWRQQQEQQQHQEHREHQQHQGQLNNSNIGFLRQIRTSCFHPRHRRDNRNTITTSNNSNNNNDSSNNNNNNNSSNNKSNKDNVNLSLVTSTKLTTTHQHCRCILTVNAHRSHANPRAPPFHSDASGLASMRQAPPLPTDHPAPAPPIPSLLYDVHQKGSRMQ
eukprot:TRINITY_DN48_c1_g1_i2.p1 TRINITY_DN48_c1_g1~~TRINITY_DN48_c1_g1_i2.p1  ORF type:complete len:191 (-),score=63.49 TRINITY_DN48_c1_g1_i2:536-1108(-)